MSTPSARFRAALPAAARKDDEALRALGLRLHDAQSCVAREYGFASWADLRSFVHARSSYRADGDKGVLDWLRLVYGGHIAGGNSRARPTVAARMLEENPRLLGDDRYLACAVGDEPGLRRALSGNRAWVNSAGGPLDLPPLVAVTHSSLVRLPGFRDSLHACAKLLLEAGADPNQAVASRWGSASISERLGASAFGALRSFRPEPRSRAHAASIGGRCQSQRRRVALSFIGKPRLRAPPVGSRRARLGGQRDLSGARPGQYRRSQAVAVARCRPQ